MVQGQAIHAPLIHGQPPMRGPLAQAGWLVFFLALCAAAAGVGGALTAQSVTTWYQTLNKPSWNPPDWVFGPVWTVLYAMMGVAAWLVWRRAGWQAGGKALATFGVQLALNVAWSGCFFTLRNPGLGLVVLVLLWLAIVATVFAFARHSRPAAWLLVPYLAWTSFAGVLNATVWVLNR